MISTNDDLTEPAARVRTLPRRSAGNPVDAVRLVDAILLLAGTATAIMIIVGVGGPVRAVISLTACLLLPGWAALRVLGVKDLYQLLMLGLITSVVLLTGLALGMVWSDFWRPDAAAVALLLVAVGALLYRIRWERRSAASSTSGPGRHPMSGPARTVADLPFPPSEPDQ